MGKEGAAVSHDTQTAQNLKQHTMKSDLEKLAELITEKSMICTKEVLTTEEAAKYLGISKSYLYKLTMQQKIPYYKPLGKMCYFNRVELEQWLQNNRISTDDEINQKADQYCMKKGGQHGN